MIKVFTFMGNLKTVTCNFLWHRAWIDNIFQSQWVTLIKIYFPDTALRKNNAERSGKICRVWKDNIYNLFLTAFFAQIIHCFPQMNRDCCLNNVFKFFLNQYYNCRKYFKYANQFLKSRALTLLFSIVE